jgi:hypothetical protein
MGSVLLARTTAGVCAISLEENETALLRELRREFPAALLSRQESPILSRAATLCEQHDPLLLKLPVALRRRIFLANMWEHLQ